MGDDDLRQAIAAGRLPRLAAVLGRPLDRDLFEHAFAVLGALAILPSMSMAA